MLIQVAILAAFLSFPDGKIRIQKLIRSYTLYKVVQREGFYVQNRIPYEGLSILPILAISIKKDDSQNNERTDYMKTTQLLNMFANENSNFVVSMNEDSGKRLTNYGECEEKINEIGTSECKEEFW